MSKPNSHLKNIDKQKEKQKRKKKLSEALRKNLQRRKGDQKVLRTGSEI